LYGPKENGGYIFSSDHSIPNSVSLENMKEIIAGVKEAGILNKNHMTYNNIAAKSLHDLM
jgi:hypothetical protein